jgi:hypothetical protein
LLTASFQEDSEGDSEVAAATEDVREAAAAVVARVAGTPHGAALVRADAAVAEGLVALLKSDMGSGSGSGSHVAVRALWALCDLPGGCVQASVPVRNDRSLRIYTIRATSEANESSESIFLLLAAEHLTWRGPRPRPHPGRQTLSR